MEPAGTEISLCGRPSQRLAGLPVRPDRNCGRECVPAHRLWPRLPQIEPGLCLGQSVSNGLGVGEPCWPLLEAPTLEFPAPSNPDPLEPLHVCPEYLCDSARHRFGEPAVGIPRHTAAPKD